MKLIVGLGNPGEKYKNNRHNAGFIALDAFAREHSLIWKNDSKFNAEICNFEDIILVKPQTFMNDSGTCVAALARFYKISLDDLMVVQDDVDLPSGVVKKQFKVGSAGHHGVEDIIEKLGTNAFWRIRIGVGRPESNLFNVEDYVLEDLSDEERRAVATIKIAF